MSARSLWLWLHNAADVRVPALAGPGAVPARPASPSAANAAAREKSADAAAGEEFQPGVWARAAAAIYS